MIENVDKKQGLSNKEAKERLEYFGFNELVKYKKPNPFIKILSIFKEPMFLLLLGAAFLYILLKEPREAIIMMVFVGFVASITFVQEWRTEKMLHALKELTSPQVTVIREGNKIVIPSIDLVPGDIVIIEEGQRIPADIDVLDYSGFLVDESSLTGESEPVKKVTQEECRDVSSDYWKTNILYAGTLSVSGQCLGIVRTTGVQTEYGKIGKAISDSKDELTPLQKKTQKLVKTFAIGGLILCILVILFSYLRTKEVVNSILAGVTLAMAIIPEEFPVVLVIFLSMGAFRMAKQNALLRKIAAVETLGSATVLCVDKTGTLTKNQMTVIDSFTFKNDNETMLSLKDNLVLASENDPFDPMEKALVQFSEKTRIGVIESRELSFIKNYPFDSKSKMMANEYKIGENYCIALKGSAESIVKLCLLSQSETILIEKEIDRMAEKGLRVLACAESCFHEKSINLAQIEFSFKGIIGLQDPPKEGAPESVKLCQNAGIRVIMITGDYEKTAMAIGKQIGLKFNQKTISGHLLEKLNEEELSEAVKTCDIFSRVIPEQKMKIIKALKNNGEIVAMTGDGVNDAPALKLSDIGIAMGKRGTEVAKEASDMVLMDDNFTTIVQSVQDGRRIYDNIQKAMTYVMIIHIPIAGITLLSPLFNLTQILLPIHIVLLELIIDPTCSIVFEGEEAESNIMKKPPRSPKEPLLNSVSLWKVVLQGLCILTATFFPFHYLVDSGFSVELARSFALVTLVSGNIFLVLINRSNSHYLLQIFSEKQNSARIWINGLAFTILFSLVYLPYLNQLFKTQPLTILFLFLAILLGFIATAWWDVVKYFINQKVN